MRMKTAWPKNSGQTLPVSPQRLSGSLHIRHIYRLKCDFGAVGPDAAEAVVTKLPIGRAGEVLEVGFVGAELLSIQEGCDVIAADLDGEGVAFAVGDGHGDDGWVV